MKERGARGEKGRRNGRVDGKGIGTDGRVEGRGTGWMEGELLWDQRSMFLRQRRCNFMVTNGSEVRALMWRGWPAVKR